MTDSDRGNVYAAEDQLTAWLQKTSEAGTLTLDGQDYAPEVEPLFTDIEAVQRYVNQVLAHLRDNGCDHEGREQIDIQVRRRRGAKKATYHYDTNEMRVPPAEIGGKWALRGLVILHEIAHHLNPNSGHGPEWRATQLRLLEEIGSPVLADLLHRAYQSYGLEAVGHHVEESTVAKIAKVLRQGERSQNPHERDAFIARAQKLAAQSSIALAVARAHRNQLEAREAPTMETVTLGEPGQRGLARYARLLINIAHANDLVCTISSDNTFMTLYGFPTDIKIARALHESLMVQMVSDFEGWWPSRAKTLEEAWDPKSRTFKKKAPNKLTNRLAFYESYAGRVGQRLQKARSLVIEEAEAAEALPQQGTVTTALALKQKEVEVHDYFNALRKEHNIRGTWRGERRHAGASAPEAAAEGRRAGGRAALGTERRLT